MRKIIPFLLTLVLAVMIGMAGYWLGVRDVIYNQEVYGTPGNYQIVWHDDVHLYE
jgi:hypothetical protein